MSSSSRTGRISIRSSEPYTVVPATIVEDVPAGYDNGTILPAAYKTVNQPFYLTADPANLNVADTLAVGGQIDLNGGVLTVAGGVLELDGVPVGGGGGGAVDSVSAGAGLAVAPTTGNVVVSMPNVGTAGIVNNVQSMTTDAQGRVVLLSSYGYIPQSAAQVAAAVAPYALRAGATFTGPVDTTATTLTVAAPIANAEAATKLYVDNAVAGITPGGAVNTVVAGTNIAVDSTNAANPIVSVAVSSALNMNTNEINNTGNISAPIGAQLDIKGGEINLIQSSTALGDPPAVGFPFATVMNLNAAGGIGLSAGGGVGINAGGIVEIGAAGTVQITSLGNISIGSGNVLGADTEIEHVSFKDNVISKYTTIAPGPNPDLVIQDVDTITMSGDLTTTADVNTKDLLASGDVVAQGFAQAPRYIVGAPGAFTDIERNADGTLLTQINGAGSIGGIVDTLINPALLSLAGTVLSIKAKDGTVSPATMSTVDLAPIIPAVPAGISKYATLSVAAGSTYTITAAQANSALWFDVAAAGNVNVLLPNGVPDGTQFFIGLPYDTAPGSQLTVFPVGGGVGGGRETVIKAANGGCLYIANGTVAGNVMYIPTDTGAYLALTGGVLSGALQVEETTNIEAKNITTALLTPLPSVGYISALGPMQVEGGNFLVANPAGSEIGLAASANPPLDQVATITYNYTNDDLIHLNKVLEAPGAVLDGNDVVPLLTFKDARTFFVSKQGSDSNDGAANAPFLTVQAAINAALAAGVEAVIDVAPGTYTESLTIASVAGLIIRGSLVSDRCVEGTILEGVISIQCNTTDNMNNNQVVIADCFVAGHIHDTSTKQHTLIVNNCRIEADTADGGRAVQVNVSSTDQRTFIQGCVITQEIGTTGLSPVISANVGWLNIYECDITVRADGCAVSVSGSAWITRLSQCAISSSSASATPNALVFLNSTTANPHAISLTSFAYNVATSKTTPAILATRPSPGVIYCTLAENVFALAGTLAAGNVVQFTVGTTLVLLVANNRSLNTAAAPYASQIQAGTTVLPLTQVGETTVNTVNGASGAITVAAGTGLSASTVNGVITLTNTKNGTLTGVGAGSGIAVNNSDPAVPVVSNTGVLRLIAGTNVSLTAETGEITISASGGGGGGGNVDTVSAGTGITLTGTAQDVIVNNAGVLSVGVGNGLVNTGTAQEPVIEISGTGTATFQDIDAVKLVVSGTGADFTTFGVLPRIAGTYVAPTEPSQLVPLQYVNGIDTGVQSVSAANASIDVGGTATAITLAVADSGVSGGTYTNATITVGADGRLTAASSGSAGVLSVVAGSGIAVDSTDPAAPVVSNTGLLTGSAGAGISVATVAGNLDIANTGVLALTAADSSITVAGTQAAKTVKLPAQIITPGAYAWPAMTVNQAGIITAITANTAPYTSLATGTGISITPGAPGAATIGNTGVINVNGFNGDVEIAAGANVVVDDSVPGTIVISSTSAVSEVSGTAGQIAVATGTTTPVISLVAAGGGEQTVPYPSSIAVDDYGRVISIASGEQTTVNTLGGAITLAAGTNMDIAQVGQTLTFNASFTPTPSITSINSETGPAITLQAGANTTITTVAPNVIEIASTGGGGGGGITSINGETGSAILITGSGNATVSTPVANTIQVYAPGKVDQIQSGYGISVDNADPMYPTINATVAALQAGSGITITPQQNNEFLISATGGGGGGVQSVNIVPGGGLLIDNTDPANPILNNGGVVSLQAFQADAGNIEIDNTDGFIGITTVADPVPGSVQKIRLAYNALNSISAADGSITLGGTSQSQSIKANPGGTAYADIDMVSAYKITRAVGINTTDKLSFAEIGGFQNGYAIKGTDAGTEPGLTRNQVDSANADVANTTAVMYDERNYSPTSPFNPASGFTPGPGGAFTSGVQKLLASQTTTLTQTNWPCKYTSKYLGVAGAISFTLSAAQPLVYQIKYKKNGGASTNASGGVYYTSTQSVSVPVNAITWTGVGGAQFTVGDTFTWEIYATYTGVSPPTIVGAPTVFSAVFSPLAV